MKNNDKDFFKKSLHFLSDIQWVLIGILWLLVYIFCLWGVYLQLSFQNNMRSFLEPFYRTFQLFLFDDSMIVSGNINSWQLEAGRFLAPLLSAYTIVFALYGMFQKQLQVFRLKKVKNHIVICGVGRKGMQLIKELRNQGKTVVAIENEKSNEYLDICLDSGVIVVEGSATDNETLLKARAHLATKVIAITGNDGDNVDIALKTYYLVKNRKGNKLAPVHCYVQVVNPKLRMLFDKHPVFTDMYDDFEISVFNTYTNAARLMFSRFPVDGEGISENSPMQPHLIIIGFGKMGEAILLQAACTGHFANYKKIKISIIDKFAEQKAKYIQGQFPAINQICDINFIQADAEEPLVLNLINELCREVNNLTSVIITLDDDARALSCALNYRSRISDKNISLIVRMSEESGLAKLLQNNLENASWISKIYSFGQTGETCNISLLHDDKSDLYAKIIHEDYVKKRFTEDIYRKNKLLTAWEKLSPDIKDSNRQQADHIMIKLRAIECKVVEMKHPSEKFEGFSDKEIEIMAIMEHNRWVAERLLAGWTRGPKDTDLRISPYLIVWDNLSEEIKEYDREAVRNIPNILSLSGHKIIRRK